MPAKTPLKFTALGLERLTPAPLSSVQEPPASGVPPNAPARSIVVPAPPLQTLMMPSVPASGDASTVTVSTAEEEGHGAAPFTV